MGSHLPFRSLMLALLLASFACNPVSLGGNVGSGGASGAASGGASGGATASSGATTGGGGDAGACDVDCTKVHTAPCEVAVCNTGQVPGPLDTCVVIPAPDGTGCDDGRFCTTGDACKGGTCAGGSQNDCGLVPGPCGSVACDESSKSCNVAPVTDGTPCTSTNLCQVGSACLAGQCTGGTPKDCTSSPLAECNSVACDPGTGQCTGTPDCTKDGAPCVLSGDLCKVDKACSAGQCAGGAPKDCSALDTGCQAGACDGANGDCVPAAVPDGDACNDHDACTQGDTCAASVCAGTPVAGCALYLDEGFESCPDGWTLNGDWQCGIPTTMSPVRPFDGHGVLATQLDGAYHDNQSFITCTADSPPIDLTHAVSPEAFFWAWVDTEGGTYDGWNLKVSSDGGPTFSEVMTVTPAYPLTISGQPAWGGDLSAQGWQPYSADLSAWAGHSIVLRFAFASDPAGVDPGVYVDDLVVAEPLMIPLYVTTPSPLPDATVGKGYGATLAKVGGTGGSVWSIAPGAVNAAWLAIDPATGALSGTPSAAQGGPVSITVRVQEPALPSNFAEKTLVFAVRPAIYYTSWEGPCPDGWTLTGDWKCGVPTIVGPATAYDGTQCLGTGMGQGYSNEDTWAGTTATSPTIVLPGCGSPTLTFRMWVDTEGGTYDGVNLEISADGGASYAVLDTVTPAYPLMIAGEPAWGGHEAALGWQLVQADLAAYAGQAIQLRFAFESDASTTAAGVYVDDFLVE